MKSKKKYKNLIIIVFGLICLLLSLLINRYVEIEDIYCIIFMVISLGVEIYGFVKVIKEN